jgi:hypothetical protein
MRSVKIIAALMLSSCLAASPVAAAELLGGLVSTGNGGLSVNAGNLASVSLGTSNGVNANASVLGGGATANASLGGGSSLASVNASAGGSTGLNTNATIGGGTNLASVNASAGGSTGLNTNATVGGGSLANVNASLGGGSGLNANVRLGGGNLANVGVSLGGGTLPGGGTGGNGTGPGGNGGGGNGGGDLVIRDPSGNLVVVNSRSGNLGITSLASLACTNRNSPQAIANLLQRHRYGKNTLRAWRRSTNVQIVPIRMCSQLRSSVRRAALGNQNVAMVQGLAASDALISASLERGRYRAGNVLAVDQAQGLLTVYVY